MEIRGIQPSRTIGIKDKVVSNKSGFSENFMKSYKSATKEELENYIKDIKKKGNKLIKRFLDSYDGKKFIKEDGQIDNLTNVVIASNIIEGIGIRLDGTYQRIDGICTVYPQEYFSPYDYINCYSKETKNTYTIHHFYKSWLPYKEKIKENISLGESNFQK